MMGKFEHIQKKYGIPIRRGVIVSCKDHDGKGRVTSTNGHHLFVRWENEKRSKLYHPLSLDYEIDGVEYLGDEYCERLNRRIDETNEMWARMSKYENEVP